MQSFQIALLLLLFTNAQDITFDPNSVDLTTKNQWCQGQLANCPTLCGGQAAIKNNLCTGSSLDYICTCTNGSSPANIDDYKGTLPNFVCEATFQQCRIANPGSDNCIPCGTLMPSDVEAVAPATSAVRVTQPAAVVQVTEIAPGTTNVLTSIQAAGATDTAGNIATAPSTIPITSTHTPTAFPTNTTTPSPARATSTTKPSSESASTSTSSGLSSSAKIGIGLGVPLGVIIAVVVIGLFLYRHRRYKQKSISQGDNFMAPAGIHSTKDHEAKAAKSGWKSGATKELKHDVDDGGSEPVLSGMPKEMKHDIRADESKNVHEVYGDDVPVPSRELPGSPGVRRSELPGNSGTL